ncbi:MAG: AAA family ATPase, partial [Succinivibrio dextrinosolvens]|nr:AAA family ATPase [Succinivibrio dextrinosolvens]
MAILLNKKDYEAIIGNVGGITGFLASNHKPKERKAYLGWKQLGPVINEKGERNMVTLKALVPFQHVLKYVGFKGNINAYPNKLVWFTFMFGACQESKLYQSCIPEFDEAFIPDPQHVNLLIDVLNTPNKPGYGRGYYGWGEAGTGKTSTAHWLLAVTNTACVQLNCKPNIEAEEMFVSHTARNGVWTTIEGPILQAVKRNWPLIIDEMDLAPAEFIPALNNLIEGRKFSVTFCDQMIQAGDNFKVIGFGNTSGSG